MTATVEMVKLDHLDDLCPDDVWDRIIELTRTVTLRVIENGQAGPGFACCPVCGDANIGRYAEKHGLGIDLCSACGFRFTNPPPTSEQLRLYYNSEAKELENIVFERTRSTRLPVFERRVDLISRHATSGKLLDVGGAVGIFVDALKASSVRFDIHVVDLNADGITKLRARHPDIAAINADIFDHGGTYDVVTLWDTIEHLPDVNRVASHLFGLLSPGGLLFVSTPNVESFEHWVGQHRHPQVEPLAHVNYFAPRNLRRLLERHGFKVIEYVTPNGSFDIAYVNRMIKDGDADLTRLGGFLHHHLLSSEFADDFAALISKHGLAGNVVMIAQRPKA